MKPFFALLIVCFMTNSAFAQTELQRYKVAADSFESRFNSGDFDAVYNSFSREMQQQLSADQTNSFLSGLRQQAGNIVRKSFAAYKNSFASYKTQFEHALLALNIAVNEDGKLSGLLIKPFTEVNVARPERNTTKMMLPFKDEWTVVWGGDTKELNYHVESETQKNAFDMVITDASGKSYKTDGATNADYYAFGKELIAPCDGEVVLVVDGVKDNIPGVSNPVYVPGNTVIIRTSAGEHVFFAHFKQHSIVVKQGQKVKQGQLLGLCGNSGNSSEPHLHFHIQNIEDMNTATGIKCYFDHLLVNSAAQTDYSPVQKDKVRNTTK